MGEGQPAWFYVDGQLRYRDKDGWTDQYQAIAGAVESNVVVRPEPEDSGSATRAPARGRREARHRQKGRPTRQAAQNDMGAVAPREGAKMRTATHGARGRTFRRIGAVVLILGATGVWFGMGPADTEATSGYHQQIAAALAVDTKSSKAAHGTAQQTVVNGWTARDLLAILAQEGSDPRSADERPAALLALLVLGLGIGLATTRLTVSEPGMSARDDLEQAT
jgi:hypothetical protein